MPHGAAGIGYENMLNFLQCCCGRKFKAEYWKDAGTQFDLHLAAMAEHPARREPETAITVEMMGEE